MQNAFMSVDFQRGQKKSVFPSKFSDMDVLGRIAFIFESAADADGWMFAAWKCGCQCQNYEGQEFCFCRIQKR